MEEGWVGGRAVALHCGGHLDWCRYLRFSGFRVDYRHGHWRMVVQEFDRGVEKAKEDG